MEQIHLESLYPAETRENEVAKILEFVKAGNSCQIVAFPGVGRSNLLRLLPYNRELRLKHLGEEQEKYHFVLVDFAEVRKKPLFEVTKFLFLEIVESLRERQMIEEFAMVNEILKESLSTGDELVLFQGLKRAIDFLAIEKELTIVFLFDRFETYIPAVTSDFFSQLRTLRNRAKYHFSVVFSLFRPLEEMIEPMLFADFHEFVAGHVIYLPIRDEPGLAFRIRHLEKMTGKILDQKLTDEVVKLTAGHGKLTRLSLEILLTSGENAYSSSEGVPSGTPESRSRLKESSRQARTIYSGMKTDLQDFLLTQTTVRGGLWEIWHALLPEEQQMLETRGEELVAGSEGSYLQKVGMIKDEKITIPIFAEFVKEEGREKLDFSEAKQGRLTFKQDTHDILQGDLSITDQLTAAEFRLLRLFLQNPDRVIEREELITAVWGDAKSTAGVTDQAIDQLIFRLRRKIEDDPNNPAHLHTVKGRGFRFTA